MENKPHPDELGTLKTVEEKLDCVLDYYKENKTNDIDKWQIVGSKVGGLYLNELDSYLRENGFITKRPDRPFTSVTIKGELFIGFVKERKNKSTLLFRQLLETRLILIGTIGAAIGTIGLLIWEIRKTYPLFLEFWKY